MDEGAKQRLSYQPHPLNFSLRGGGFALCHFSRYCYKDYLDIGNLVALFLLCRDLKEARDELRPTSCIIAT